MTIVPVVFASTKNAEDFIFGVVLKDLNTIQLSA